MSTLSNSRNPQPANTTVLSSNAHRHPEPPYPHRQATPRTTCRSVKSIVAWLESSSTSQQPCSPSTTLADLPRDLSTGSASVRNQRARWQAQISPASTDVEDYSLTYLRYQNYFAGAPLARCLDEQHDSGSARKFITEEGRASQRRKGVYERGGLALEGDLLGEEHVGKTDVAAGPAFIRRDPDEVRAF